MDAQGFHPHAQPAALTRKLAFDRDMPSDGLARTPGNIHQHRRLGGLPDGDICLAVASIHKAWPYLLPNGLQLGPALEVVTGLRRQHLVKQAQVPGHVAGNRMVGRRRQDNHAALPLFRAQVIQQGRTVREVFARDAGMRRNGFLETCPPSHEPERHAEQVERGLLHHLDDRFKQGIAWRQRAVKIDNQGHFGRNSHHGLPILVWHCG